MIRNSRFLIAFYLLSLALPLCATEYSPWLPRKYDVFLKGGFLGQFYSSLNASRGNTHKPAGDLLVFLGAEGAPLDDADVELEFISSQTRYKDFSFDAIKLTGRYQWTSDIIGDPITLTTGVTFYGVSKQALHDLSWFYHGRNQVEAHIAYGKETECEQFWCTRTWGLIGMGIADVGSAWLRGNVVWERNWCDLHRLKIFANSLWGFGQKRLRTHHHFKGYGSIHHQSVDIGVGYTHILPYKIELVADYSYRAYARNCPEGVSLIQVYCLYPLSL